MIQELLGLNTVWDEYLPEQYKQQWFKWFEEINDLKDIEIPRRYLSQTNNYAQVQLHIFCDSSTQAYGAVAYMRIDSQTTFVNAKSKVAPIKSPTLPRLELQAALLGAKLSEHIVNNISIKELKVILWTDSQIVLSWLHTTKQLPAYIANRLTNKDNKPTLVDILPRPSHTRDLTKDV